MIEFVPATTADLPKIVAIYNETIPTHQATADLQPQTVDQKAAWFAAHNDHFPAWMIQVDHHNVGWLTLSAYSDRAAYDQTAEISLYLDITARGQHIGSSALAFVAQEFSATTRPVGVYLRNLTTTTGAIYQLLPIYQKEKPIWKFTANILKADWGAH